MRHRLTKAKKTDKGKEEITEQEDDIRIRVVPELSTKDEVKALLTIENLDKITDPQYKEWLIKRLRELYPGIMERSYGEKKEEVKK